MPQFTSPTQYPDWTTGGADQIAAPTPSQQASGFTSGQRPSFQTLNYLFYNLGRWVRFISQGVNAVLVGANQETDFRLLAGGAWSWNATTGVLAWSETAYIACPGYADAANFIAVGSVALTAGQLAYVAANVPFSTTGTTTSGSATISNLAFESGIVAGAAVTGPGIAPGSTVAAISQSDSTLTLSKPATASAANVSLVFGGGNAQLTVQAANTAGFVPSSTTVVIARCYAQNGAAAAIQLGVNAGVTRILDGESKALLGNGYVTTMRAVAGAAIAARQPVYISPGASDSRTAGSAYPLDVSASGTSVRATLAGVAASAVASGGMCEIVLSGRLAGFGTLTPGATYYASPTAPATLQVATPSAAGQYVVPVGTALSADVLAVNRTPALSVAALGSTSVFAGPVSAPSFVSGSGFKCQLDFGSVAGGNATAQQSVPLGRVIGKDGGTTFSSLTRTMGGTGSILGVLISTPTQSAGNLFIYRNNNQLIAQLSVNSTQVNQSTWLTKGSQSFSQGDQLYVFFTPSNAGSLQISVDLIVEFNA